MLSLLLIVERTADAISWAARIVVVASGIALTAITTANVIARYALAGGGFPFAQELPMLIFPWFILGGIVLAAHVGGHMTVEWLYDKLNGRARDVAFVTSNAISIATFLTVSYQAVLVAEIAAAEHSPVLRLPNSIGYYSLAVGALMVSLVTLGATARVVRVGWSARTVGKLEEIPL
jgi:TRAP-type transport system small permease protein